MIPQPIKDSHGLWRIVRKQKGFAHGSRRDEHELGLFGEAENYYQHTDALKSIKREIERLRISRNFTFKWARSIGAQALDEIRWTKNLTAVMQPGQIKRPKIEVRKNNFGQIESLYQNSLMLCGRENKVDAMKNQSWQDTKKICRPTKEERKNTMRKSHPVRKAGY